MSHFRAAPPGTGVPAHHPTPKTRSSAIRFDQNQPTSITVTGALTRANWETGKYSGYVSQPAKLQFRAKGSSTYGTVKTVTSGTGGALKTTVKAAKDGYFRYVFAGTSTTAAATAAGDFIDVQ